jgi:cytochrome P450
MSDVLTADDPRYQQIFNASREAETLGEKVIGNIAPEVNALREASSVHKGSLPELLGLPTYPENYTVERDHYTIFSFTGCDFGFRDNLTFSSEGMWESVGVQALGQTILSKIGEDHRALRAVAQPMFIAPKVAKWWHDNWIAEVAGTLLDNLAGKHRADLNMDLCARMPVNVITPAMGLDGDKALLFRENLIRATFSRTATREEKKVSMTIVEDILRDVIRRRRSEPADDVVTGLLNNDLALPGGGTRKLTDEEVINYCRLVMNAGGGTTWRQLGITLVALLTHEGNWQALREDRNLVKAAVQESLRWLPTDPMMSRVTTREVDVDGIMIPAGARIDLCLAAANRDPRRWDSPDVYDIFRPYQYNLGVGLGPHMCLGANVARHEMECAINGLLDRYPNLQLDPDAPPPEVRGDLGGVGMTSVPVLLN